MDGDVAPLQELAKVCTELGAHLIVDEAHSIGIDGPLGAGLVAERSLQQQVFAVVTTYGKAMGCAGAAVLGSSRLRSYLINASRPFIFTTAPRPEQLARIDAAYRQLEEQQPAAKALLTKVLERFSINAFYLRIQPPDQPIDGPIQLIYPRGKGDVIEMERAMLQDGFLVKGIRPPTVPRGEERLRICLHAFNTEQEVDDLTAALRRRLEQLM
jgi:8-amino-7-oxononanoate synthase